MTFQGDDVTTMVGSGQTTVGAHQHDNVLAISFERDSYRILLLSHRQCGTRLDTVSFALPHDKGELRILLPLAA